MKKIAKAIVQPVKCRGCVWGRWQDTIQLCFKLDCEKDGGKDAKGNRNSQAFNKPIRRE